jgi:hypothetical protein
MPSFKSVALVDSDAFVLAGRPPGFAPWVVVSLEAGNVFASAHLERDLGADLRVGVLAQDLLGLGEIAGVTSAGLRPDTGA